MFGAPLTIVRPSLELRRSDSKNVATCFKTERTQVHNPGLDVELLGVFEIWLPVDLRRIRADLAPFWLILTRLDKVCR